MLVTPETSDERVREIDRHTGGFIYMVSSAAVTGAQRSFDEQKQAYFRRIDSLRLKHPRLVGFGISNKATFEAACRASSGAIIGSRFVTLLSEAGGRRGSGHRPTEGSVDKGLVIISGWKPSPPPDTRHPEKPVPGGPKARSAS